MKVQHTKTGRVAEVLSQDAKQVRIRFEDGTEQGMIPLTFKRWWKVIDDTSDESAGKTVKKDIEALDKALLKAEKKTFGKALVDDDKCGDGTPLAEVGKEILEQAKQKVEKIKKEKKPSRVKKPVDSSKADSVREWILNYVKKQGGEIFVPANGMKMRTFKVGGKMYGRMDFSSKKVTLSFKEVAIEDVHMEPDSIRNHMFNHLFYITELTPKSEKNISVLLDSAIKYQKAKNEKSKKKSKKEEK